MVQNNYDMEGGQHIPAEDHAEIIGLLEKCENCGLAFPECTEMRNGKQICIVKKSEVTPKSDEAPLDPVQKAMGSIGKWHILICAVVFPLKFPVAWHQMSNIFLAAPTSFECVTENGTNPAIDHCSELCVSHEFNRSVFTETIITEWDLVCDSKYLSNLSQTIFMLGILFGNIIFGSLADKYGRRNPLVFAVILQFITAVATAFTPYFWLFCVLRFLTAFATGGTMVTSFVLIMEIIGPKWRELISVVYQIPFYIGHLSIPIFAYFLRDWHYFQFALAVPSLLLVSYYWLVPESPRWLFTVGRIDESAEILTRAAKRNKLPTATIKSDLAAAAKIKADKGEGLSKGNILDLVRTPNMRAKTFFMCFNWFVCGLTFFGLAQYIGHTGGNIFVNVMISGGLTLPGNLICIYTMKAWGRRLSLIASNTLTGIAMISIAFIPVGTTWATVTLASIGIVGMSISFSTVYLYAGELFPTVVRNVGMGAASMIARVGSMVAPFVAGIDSHWMPPVIFGVIPLIGAIFVFYLPETIGTPLPETIEDGENFGKKKLVLGDDGKKVNFIRRKSLNAD